MNWPTELKTKPIIEWPGELTKHRQRSNFASTLSSTLQLLSREITMLKGRDVFLQIAVPREKFRIDGRPYADAKAAHPGVILTMESKFGSLSYPCDNFATWQDNLRAIALALEALRKVDRYGVTKRGEQYKGFLELESAQSSFLTGPEEAIQFLAGLVASPIEQVRPSLNAALRIAKRHSHPDMGGNAEQFQKVIEAEKILKTAGRI